LRPVLAAEGRRIRERRRVADLGDNPCQYQPKRAGWSLR